jgi:DNA polymerase I
MTGTISTEQDQTTEQGLINPALDPTILLFGRDPTPGIVSISVLRTGVARVWRREGDAVHYEEVRFTNWFFLSERELLDGLDAESLEAGVLRDGIPELQSGLGVVTLDGKGPYRWLVLTTRLPEVEAHLLAAARRGGMSAKGLGDLRGSVYLRSPSEQYLTLSGRTYFKGMTFDDLRRMQFDLETTGLDSRKDRIFMISVSDSTGFQVCLDSADEGGLIERFVQVVRERDPDVLENHNVFGFDIPFLVRRAEMLGVNLALGRDGSVPGSHPDSLKIGEKSDSFTRWTVVGREIVDTLHAVRRYGAIVRDMRQHSLKESARYFGFASDDREYVPGAEIWNTFQSDPERVRRYARDDVSEVAELSRLLLQTSFALAQVVPKPYERVATSGTGQGLIEPLLVRAYLSCGQALPRGQSAGGSYSGARTDLFTSGVVQHVVKADVASLYPSIMLTYKVGPRSDDLGAFLTLLRELTTLRLRHKAEARRHPPDSRDAMAHEAASGAMKQLINSFYGSLGTSFALFADLQSAGDVTRRGREILGQMLMELERRGMLLIEADTDGVLFSVPANWTEADERKLIDEVGETLPEGIRIEHDGRYAQMYSYAEKNYILQGYDGKVRLVGGSFRSSKSERYGEQFLREAAPLLLAGDFEGLRSLYLDTVARLRARAVPIDDLCVSVVLTKTPQVYARSGRREEQYEVLLAAGRESWRPGQRVRYYQARGKRKKLVEDFEDDYDAEHYVRRLRQTYCQRLAKALTVEDFELLFGENLSLFETNLADIRPITTRERSPTPY